MKWDNIQTARRYIMADSANVIFVELYLPILYKIRFTWMKKTRRLEYYIMVILSEIALYPSHSSDNDDDYNKSLYSCIFFSVLKSLCAGNIVRTVHQYYCSNTAQNCKVVNGLVHYTLQLISFERLFEYK